jgi:hypothetical protein
VFFREKILAGGYKKLIGKKNIVGGEKGKKKKLHGSAGGTVDPT